MEYDAVNQHRLTDGRVGKINQRKGPFSPDRLQIPISAICRLSIILQSCIDKGRAWLRL